MSRLGEKKGTTAEETFHLNQYEDTAAGEQKKVMTDG